MKRKNEMILLTLLTFLMIIVFFIVKDTMYKTKEKQVIKAEDYKDDNKKVMKQMDDRLVFNEYIKDKYDAKQVFEKDGKKIAFLTFDDGPSALTKDILDVLKKYDVKATFFIVGNLAENNKQIIERQAEEGHSIGNHTYTHNYKNIYSSTQVFTSEIHKTQNVIKSILGSNYDIKLVRFPGGSFGNRFQPYKQVLQQQGYYYIDWNALNGDAEGQNIPKEKLVQNIKDTVQGKNHVVILMHDAPAKRTTVEALPKIIEYLKTQGYEFKALK